MIPRRQRWVAGRYANVDGIPYAMPVATPGSPIMFALYSADAEKIREFLPGTELHPFKLWNKGVVAIEVVNYLETTIGRYVEFSMGVLCTHGRRPSPRLIPGVFMKHYGTGQYIYDLAVSTEISVKGGLGIWGMPKRKANLDYRIGNDWVSSQYDLDGKLVFRLDVKRPGSTWIPGRMKGVGYGAFRGLLMKSYIYLKGKTGITFGAGGGRLLLGDHPRAEPIRALNVNPEPIVTGFMPRAQGWLDDYIETWFMIHNEVPPVASPNLHDVVDLGLSEEWLAPPDREMSDRLMRERYPESSHTATVIDLENSRPADAPG